MRTRSTALPSLATLSGRGAVIAVLCAPVLPDALSGQADNGGPLVIPLLTGPIEMDGRVDEPAWEAVPRITPQMHTPTFRGDPTEETEFRVAHDGENIYFSCRAFDSDPSSIRAPSLQRDESSFSNDWCVLVLDAFFDRETSLVFGTTPAGLRTDVIFSNDTEGAINFDWNTFWDAEVSRDDRGWYAELRIPLTSLRFQQGDDGVTMGMSVWRLIARKNEIVTYPAISPEWGIYSPFKASQSREVLLEGVRGGNPLYVTPYGIGGGGYAHTLNDDATAYDRDRDAVGEIGGDLKYGLTENLTLDVSVNTDFAQVEADDQQVNLTRFSLFFPEKRTFFQERSNVFDYSLGGDERLFHSRRIGLAEGEPVQIYGGARVVGRVDDWDVGLLSMQTEAPVAGGVSENTSVARLRRRVLNENSYVGGIATTRLGNDDTENAAYGLDAILRLFGQDYLTLNWSQSFEPDEGGADFLDRSYARLFWERRGLDGLTYSLDLSRSGAVYEPGLGFLFRRDYAKGAVQLGHGWRPGPESPLLRHTLTVDGSAFRRGADRSIETATLQPRWEFETKSGHLITARVTTTYDDLDVRFSLPEDTEVPVGDYTFTQGRVQFRQSFSAILRSNVIFEYGSFYDGRRGSASITTTWNPVMYLELEGRYQLEDVDFADRDQGFRAHIVSLRTEARLNTRLTSAALVQVSSAGDLVSVNLRVRYNPREGDDLYIVWNEGLVTNRLSFDPARPFSDRRTLLIKYSRTFTLGT